MIPLKKYILGNISFSARIAAPDLGIKILNKRRSYAYILINVIFWGIVISALTFPNFYDTELAFKDWMGEQATPSLIVGLLFLIIIILMALPVRKYNIEVNMLARDWYNDYLDQFYEINPYIASREDRKLLLIILNIDRT